MTSKHRLSESYFPADDAHPVLDLSCGDVLRNAAADAPERLALVEVAPSNDDALAGTSHSHRTWTYAELLESAEACARWLLQLYRPGDRVVVWAPNIPEWVILQYGAAFAGLVLVTANPALRASELRYLLEQSQAAGLFYAATFRGSDMSAIAAEATADMPSLHQFCFTDWPRLIDEASSAQATFPTVDPGSAAQIQYTSGTTGFPKGALLHHRGLVTNARYFTLRAELAGHSSLVSAMPLFHTSGCTQGVLGTAHLRGTYVMLQLFDASLMLGAVRTFQPQAIIGVPTMLIALMEHPDFREADFASMQVAFSGGAPITPELVHRVQGAFGCRFSTLYGMTELSPTVTQTSPHDSDTDQSQTAGRPLWNSEVRIIDVSTGGVVATNEQGEICVRGYQVMLEYYNMPERTAETIDAEGWLHTGDLGCMDERGYLRITGRLKDMIIRGGENIYPAEIERLLVTHPQVADAAVVGVPDIRWGETIAAVIRTVSHDDLPSVEELRALCRQELAPHKTPAHWFLVEEFPLTGSGKIAKVALREGLSAGQYGTLG